MDRRQLFTWKNEDIVIFGGKNDSSTGEPQKPVDKGTKKPVETKLDEPSKDE